MTSEMTNLRKEDLSVYYYIKNVVLGNFIEIDEMVLLEFSAELSSCNISGEYESEVYIALTDMLPNPTERGRGWVYLDPVVSGTGCELFDTEIGQRADGVTVTGTPEQSTMVTVYEADGVTVIPSTEYVIDYIDGRIVTSGTCAPAYVTYNWHYVSVVDEWAAIEAADPPVVVIDIHGTDIGGYQIGPGRKITRKVDIHIFASNTAERNDLVETIQNGLYLKSSVLFDFPLGTILDYDGTWYGSKDNPGNKLTCLFDRRGVSNYVGYMNFDNVTSRHVNLPLLMTRSRDEVMLSDLNAYRSKISFDLVTYTKW